MIKIIIVDDHSIVRSGLRKILKEEPDVEVIGEGWAQLNEDLKKGTPDIVLLDISSMQGKNGLEVVKELKEAYPRIKTLMLGIHPENRLSARAPHERLSDREFQILCMIASGKKAKKIAEELFLSPATVATYRARIREKMQLKSNVELSNYVFRHNLIE